MKKVSIIIPNYNNAKYLKRMLDSILCQSYKNYEVIFIDDGSTDNSVKIIKKLVKNEKIDIRIIEQFNQNGSIARNKGIEIANGDYALFLDSDDELFDSNTLKNMVSKIKKSDLLLGDHIIVDELNNQIGEYHKEKNILNYDNQYKYVEISPVPSSKLYVMSIIKNNGLYFSNVRIGQDLNFFLKYLAHAKSICVSDDYFYKYRIVNTSMTRTNNINFLDIYHSVDEIRKHYIKIGLEEDFYRYVSPTCIGNISGQMKKVSRFRNHSVRKAIFSYLTFAVNDFVNNNRYKTKPFVSKVQKFRLKKILLKLNIKIK